MLKKPSPFGGREAKRNGKTRIEATESGLIAGAGALEFQKDGQQAYVLQKRQAARWIWPLAEPGYFFM